MPPGAIINKDIRDAGKGGTSLKVAGLGFISLIVVLAGLVIVAVGIGLGVLQGHALGAMVGMIVGIGTVVVALIFKND